MKFVCTYVPVWPCRHVQCVCAMACAAMLHQKLCQKLWSLCALLYLCNLAGMCSVCALWLVQRWHISSFTVINYEVCVTLCDHAGMCSVCALWHAQRWHISSFTVINYEVCVTLCDHAGMCSVCALWPVQQCYIKNFANSYEVCVPLLYLCDLAGMYSVCALWNVQQCYIKTLPKVMKFVCTYVPAWPCRYVQRVHCDLDSKAVAAGQQTWDYSEKTHMLK